MSTNTNQTYRPIQSATPGIGGLLRLSGAIILIAIVAGWLLSSYRAGEVLSVSEPLPQAQDPAIAQTYQIPTGNPDYPELTFALKSTGAGYNLIDVDGDVFFCEALPATLASMEQCTITTAATGEGHAFGVR